MSSTQVDMSCPRCRKPGVGISHDAIGEVRCALVFAIRWSRAWKLCAKKWNWGIYNSDEDFMQAFRNAMDINRRKEKARIAGLEDALRRARPLLQDIMDIHRDPEDGEYHECDTDPCAWCTEAKELVEKP